MVLHQQSTACKRTSWIAWGGQNPDWKSDDKLNFKDVKWTDPKQLFSISKKQTELKLAKN